MPDGVLFGSSNAHKTLRQLLASLAALEKDIVIGMKELESMLAKPAVSA